MFQCSFFCHCYLTHLCIILLSLPPSSLPLSCFLFICFEHSDALWLCIFTSCFQIPEDRWCERHAHTADSLSTHTHTHSMSPAHVWARVETDVLFSSNAIRLTLEITEMLHSTCTTAHSARACVCVRERETETQEESDGEEVLLKLRWLQLSCFGHVCTCVVLIWESRTQFTELRVYFTAVWTHTYTHTHPEKV